jgi:hypothetical protein
MAMSVASEAAVAAGATADASRTALESAKLAEVSALKTARLARELAAVTVNDLADAESAEALADRVEANAQLDYHTTTARLKESVASRG